MVTSWRPDDGRQRDKHVGPFHLVCEEGLIADAELRVSPIGAQLLGLGILRYVLRLPPVADASLDELAEQMGPLVEAALRATNGRPGWTSSRPPSFMRGGEARHSPEGA